MSDLIQQGIDQACELIRQRAYAPARLLLAQGIKTYSEVNDFHNLMGIVEAQEGSHAKAIEHFNQALDIKETAATLNSRALSLSAVGERDKAVKDYLRAIELSPTYAPAYANYANLLQESGRTTEALNVLDSGLDQDARAHYLWFNRGNILGEMGSHLAINAHKMAVRLSPNTPDYHFNLACDLLLRNKWDEAWPHFEERAALFPQHHHKREALSKIAPEWKGGIEMYHDRREAAVTGKRVYVYCVQGDGDKIQFARLCKWLKELGAYVILECPDSLRPLFNQLSYVDETAPQQAVYQMVNGQVVGCVLNDLPTFDYHVELMSLMRIFQLTPDRVPHPCDFWPQGGTHGVLPFDGKAHVGICWAGNPEHKNDHRRSCHLSCFDGLANMPNVQLYSLQKDVRQRVWPTGKVDLSDAPCAKKIIHLGEQFKTYADTAYEIQKLDLVISVDTSVAHLAASMGKPTYILLPFAPDWRWGMKVARTPWYPSATLFRQDRAGDWAGVFKRVETRVASLSKLREHPRQCE